MENSHFLREKRCYFCKICETNIEVVRRVYHTVIEGETGIPHGNWSCETGIPHGNWRVTWMYVLL